MNVILVLIDSCNRHYLSPYGCRDVRTPNIQRLADNGVMFTNHIIGSAPCMPARRELMTGRREFLYRGWGPLEPFDRPLALEARRAGAVTQMVTDHYHYWENCAHGYLEYFNGSEMIRGHECDYHVTRPAPDEPDWVAAINRWRPGWGSRYYCNVAHFRREDDFFSPTVFRKAAEWLDENSNQESFFLQVESFDAHEPFHVPEPYRSMYTSDLDPSYTCWPPYQNAEQRAKFLRSTSLAELDFIRAQYQGKLTMVDTALGQLWEAMDRHGLWDNTAVILTTDHGHELAEAIRELDEVSEDGRDSTGRVPFGKQHPHYLSHANIPLIVWQPDMQGHPREVDALTTAVDLYPTILEMLGAGDVDSPHGRSLMQLLEGREWERDFTYWGTFGEGICCTDGRHVLCQGAAAGPPLYSYSAQSDGSPDAVGGKFIPGVDCPVWRIPQPSWFAFPSILFDRHAPLFAECNIIDESPLVASSMRAKLKEALARDGCPPEQFDRLML